MLDIERYPVRNPRCRDCGHVGNRAFGPDGVDVLSRGLRVEHTICQCGSTNVELVPKRPISEVTETT